MRGESVVRQEALVCKEEVKVRKARVETRCERRGAHDRLLWSVTHAPSLARSPSIVRERGRESEQRCWRSG